MGKQEDKCYIAALDKEMKIYLLRKVSRNSVASFEGKKGYTFMPILQFKKRCLPLRDYIIVKELKLFIDRIIDQKEDYVIISYDKRPEYVLRERMDEIANKRQMWELMKPFKEEGL